KNVVLVAPAGDDGQGPGLTDYPAAYTGVIAVGAVARNGQVAPFSSRHAYVSLTAPGVGLTAAIPPDRYARISSSSTSSGVVAGLCVLIVLLVALLLVMRSRRERARAAAEPASGRNTDARPRGQHEQRRPEPVSGPVIGHQGPSLAPPSGRAGGWAATGGWQ